MKTITFWPAQRIKILRLYLKLNTIQFSEALGVTRQALYRWESGKSSPAHDNMRKLEELQASLPQQYQRTLANIGHKHMEAQL